ncbi:hypothetical protein [Streptomyces chartreusis]|uniref:hypothetical protein n=1 Tax=Streptomyces chartreusis TaxID=1969 RepID=UPI0037F913A2
MGTTGHLRHDAAIPFTVGVCEAGHFYVRNEESGASTHLPVSTTAELDTLANALCDVIGDLL